jgi:hypothetical protein
VDLPDDSSVDAKSRLPQAGKRACRLHRYTFDDKPTTPHQWPRQPWFAEVGDGHGHGNLIIFTDGSIGDLKTVVASQSGK